MQKSLRDWRVDRLLSVRQLAEKAGVTHKTVIDLEHGRRKPTYDTIRKLGEALAVEPRQVIEFDEALDDRSKDAA